MAVNQRVNNNLDKKIIKKIKRELLERKKQITEELNALTDEKVKNGHKVKFPDFGDKTDENAQEINEYSTNLATDQVLENTLRDINNTIDRIKKDAYGICKYCKQPIGEKRLLARPVASACVSCKTKLQDAV